VEVRTGSQPGFLDPSCKFCMPGAPHWRYCGEGSGGIRVRIGGSFSEVRLGGVGARINVERLNQVVTLSPEGAARIEGTVSWQAQIDTELRESLAPLTDEARREEVLESFVGNRDAAEVSLSDPEDLGKNLQVTFAYATPDLAVRVGGKLLVRLPDVFSRALGLPLEERRTSPVWWPFARTVRAETVLVVPEGHLVTDLPEDTTLNGPGLRFEAGWRGAEGTSDLTWVGMLTVFATSIDPEEYADARRFAGELRESLRRRVVLDGPGEEGR
jgi:hypothetical protein